ncbi:MAG: hypothetical protein JW751_02285 [Polyangiaceae bacterium]|nr:hypothetical protein [Polyangiaceae bacterium]
MAKPSQQLIRAALLETLDSVVSPAVRVEVLSAALGEVEGGVLPDDVYGFRRFVHGPLKDALVRVLGASLAETISLELELTGCSIPPTVRPAPASSRIPSSILVDPVIPPNAVPRSLSPSPRRRSPGPAQARRSSPPSGRRSFSPRSGTPVLRGSTRTTRPGLFAPTPEEAGNSHQGGALRPPSTPAFAELDPLASLPPLELHERDVRTWPTKSRAVCAPHAAAFLDGPILEATSQDLGAKPAVVVATRDDELLHTLVEWLGDRAEVRVVNDVLDLVGEAVAQRRVLVVIDCNRPSVRPVAVAALVDELPQAVAVLLWAPSEDDEAAIRTVAPETASWHRCGASAAARLAIRCVELVS